MLTDSLFLSCLFLAFGVFVPSGAEDLNPLMLYFEAQSKLGHIQYLSAWVTNSCSYSFPSPDLLPADQLYESRAGFFPT